MLENVSETDSGIQSDEKCSAIPAWAGNQTTMHELDARLRGHDAGVGK